LRFWVRGIMIGYGYFYEVINPTTRAQFQTQHKSDWCDSGKHWTS